MINTCGGVCVLLKSRLIWKASHSTYILVLDYENLSIFLQKDILDIWQGSEYTSGAIFKSNYPWLFEIKNECLFCIQQHLRADN